MKFSISSKLILVFSTIAAFHFSVLSQAAETSSTDCDLSVQATPVFVEVLATSVYNHLPESKKNLIQRNFERKYLKRTSYGNQSGSFVLSEITQQYEYRENFALNKFGQGAYYLLVFGTGGLAVPFLDENEFNNRSTYKSRWIAQVNFIPQLTPQEILKKRCEKLTTCLLKATTNDEIQRLSQIGREIGCDGY